VSTWSALNHQQREPKRAPDRAGSSAGASRPACNEVEVLHDLILISMAITEPPTQTNTRMTIGMSHTAGHSLADTLCSVED
jgi:hypothetical protein